MPKMMVIGLVLVCALCALHLNSTRALAQERPGFGLVAPSSGEQASRIPRRPAGPPGIIDRAWLWVVGTQYVLVKSMSDALRHLKTGSFADSAAILAGISFVYGVLHAVGPGHGKFVVSSYALANDRTIRRGVLLSFMAAFIQALSAIAIVGLLSIVLRSTGLQMRLTEARLETASWGLIALFGAWLLFGQLRRLWATWRTADATDTHARHDHGAHDHAHGAHDHHDQGHIHDESCGHAHVATPEQLGGQWSWPKAWSLALSIGIRPCTGAIGVLIFAFNIGLFWAGILATFAMAVGTALTVSSLAILAVASRKFAERLAGTESRWAANIQSAAGVVGSALIIIMGATFFVASLHGGAPL